MRYYQDDLIAEALRHPASFRMRRWQAQNMVRKPKAEKVAELARTAGRSIYRGKYKKLGEIDPNLSPEEQQQRRDEINQETKSKAGAYYGLSRASRRRAREKQNAERPGQRHSVRPHLFSSDSSKRYIAHRGEYVTPEQEAREARASKAGYIGTGKNLESKNPKKIRKDDALRKMSRTPVSSDNFGKFAKESLKEMYYFVLDHLLVEGYADTYENADAIFQIMSEEWFEDILLNG